MGINSGVHSLSNGIHKINVKDNTRPMSAAGYKEQFRAAEPHLKDTPAYMARKIRVLTIGAGYSGLTLAQKLQHQHVDLNEFVDHIIYEARSELGGTWLVNTYPGVVCDVPSHIYVRTSFLRVFVVLLKIYRLFHLTPTLNGPGFFRRVRKFWHI